MYKDYVAYYMGKGKTYRIGAVTAANKVSALIEIKQQHPEINKKDVFLVGEDSQLDRNLRERIRRTG